MNLQYVPYETVEPSDCHQQPSAERVSCDGCGGKTYCGGAAVIDREHGVEWFPQFQAYGVLRRVYCDHCDHLIEWIEAVKGEPIADDNAEFSAVELTGVVLCGPGHVTCRKTIRRFLKDNPEAAGVSQR